MLLKRLFKSKFIITFLVSIFLVIKVSPVFSQIPTSNVKSSNPRLLVQQGEEFYRQQKLSTALKYFKKAADIFEQQEDKFNQAITLTNLGRLQLELGQANNALNNWQTSEKIYFQLGDKAGITRSKIYQSSA